MLTRLSITSYLYITDLFSLTLSIPAQPRIQEVVHQTQKTPVKSSNIHLTECVSQASGL